VDAEVERLSQLGATVKKEFREPKETVIVMQDPEGNEFCVCSL
jgi:predicted enzyme related to lactoylglutathione lyase